MTEQEAFTQILRNDFYSYIKMVFKEVTGGEEFYNSWHLQLMCDRLEQCRTGKIKRLIINVPPRSLKSIVTSVGLTSWILGHNPKEDIVTASYSGELSNKFARDVKLVMGSSWYKSLFPKTRISRERYTASDFTTTAQGSRLSTSVDGTLTGRGGNFIIVDDPLKPGGVDSENAFEKVNSWYRGTLLSRLNNKEKGCIIIIMQRLHEDDLSGYLLAQETGWEHVKIPALAEEQEIWKLSDGTVVKRREKGDVINEAQMSKKTLEEFRKEMGPVVFEGQYQQNPTPMEGAILKPKWFKRYSQEELPEFDKIIISWDTASKVKETNAYSACCVLGVKSKPSKKYYLLEVYRDRLEIQNLFKKIKESYCSYKEHYGCRIDLLIEDASSGIHIIQLLKAEDYYCTAIKPSNDKLSRFEKAAVIVERGDVFVPQTKQSWWAEFENEIIRFPNSKYKDQADSFAQVFAMKEKRIAGVW